MKKAELQDRLDYLERSFDKIFNQARRVVRSDARSLHEEVENAYRRGYLVGQKDNHDFGILRGRNGRLVERVNRLEKERRDILANTRDAEATLTLVKRNLRGKAPNIEKALKTIRKYFAEGT